MGIVTKLDLPCVAMTGIMKVAMVGIVLLLGACGGSKSTTGSTGKVGAIEAMGITPPDSPWEEMSVADKEFYMIGKVNPIMKELFTAHDAKEFSEFDCVDCHGEEMREIDFKMPAPSMYVVLPRGHARAPRDDVYLSRDREVHERDDHACHGQAPRGRELHLRWLSSDRGQNQGITGWFIVFDRAGSPC